MTAERTKPSRLLHWFFRLPIGIYRARLGWLFGHRLLMLTHVGRKSGLVRRTVLEVVGRDRSADEFFVVAGYGPTSDWYRNALANPPLAVDVAARRFVPRVRELTEPQRRELLENYLAVHPRAAAALGERLLGMPFRGEEDLPRAAAELPALGLSPDKG